MFEPKRSDLTAPAISSSLQGVEEGGEGGVDSILWRALVIAITKLGSWIMRNQTPKSVARKLVVQWPIFTQTDSEAIHNPCTELNSLYLTSMQPSQPLIFLLVTHTHTHTPQTPQTIQIFKKSFEECLKGFESIISSDPKLELPSLLFNDISQLGNHNCFLLFASS